MKRLRILFVLSLFLSIQSFCSWNQDNFNQLKTNLNETGAPFCAIVVSKSGNDPINSVDQKFIEIVLRRIIASNFSELTQEEIVELSQQSIQILQTDYSTQGVSQANKIDDPELMYLQADVKLKEFLQKEPGTNQNLIDKYKNIFTKNIIPNIKYMPNMPIKCGFCIFNEYFFYGQNPIPVAKAEQKAKEISLINPSIIYGCNFLTIDNFDPSFEDVFDQYKNEEAEEGSLLKRCSSSVSLTRTRQLENKTFFICNNNILATYNKSTYIKECDNVLVPRLNEYGFYNGGFYKFGDWDIDIVQETPLARCLCKNILPQTCADYGFKQGKECNFQIIQAYGTEPAYMSEKYDRDFSKFIIYADKHSALFPEKKEFVSLSIKDPSSGKSIPVPPVLRISFELNGIQYCIDVNECKEESNSSDK